LAYNFDVALLRSVMLKLGLTLAYFWRYNVSPGNGLYSFCYGKRFGVTVGNLSLPEILVSDTLINKGGW